MELHINQKRAVAMLAQGRSATAVSIDLDVCRQTLARWRRIPEFQDALDRAVAELALNSRNQVEATARIAIEGGLDAVMQLRNIVVREGTSDHDCRLACVSLVRITERFWDLLGYNAKYAKKQTLLCDQLHAVSRAPSIGEPAVPGRVQSGDRTQRDATDVDPRPPGAHALSTPPEFSDWRRNPVNNDGTRKTRKRRSKPYAFEKPQGPSTEHRVPPAARVAREVQKVERKVELAAPPDVTTTIAASAAASAPAIQSAAATSTASPMKKVCSARGTRRPGAYQREMTRTKIAPRTPHRRKAWKRSATTARCKPSAPPPPVSTGTTRASAEVPAACLAPEISNGSNARVASTPDTSISQSHGPG